MPSKQYFATETATSFKGSGGDKTMTFASLANGSCRVGAQWDRGSGSKPGLYIWKIKTKASSTLTAGNSAKLYVAQSMDTTDIPGRIPATDQTISSGLPDRFRNLTLCGSVALDSTTNTDSFVAVGLVELWGRYVSPVFYNDFGQALSSTESDHEIIFTPYVPEMQ